jgi:phosphopantothenoylcysteine synthetase/decarboxylase
LLVGLTGSVGAIALPQFVLHLRQGLVRDIRVMMSQASTRFVTPYAMQICSGHPVFVHGFEVTDGITVPLLELTRRQSCC